MTTVEALILGLVQGVTEFLPISSTGHLILARSWFDLVDERALAFDAVLHLATAAAVILYFHKDIGRLVWTLGRVLTGGRLKAPARDVTLLSALAVGTVPAVVLGLSLETLLATLFRSPLLVAGVLVVGSLLFMYAERQYRRQPRDNRLTVKKGLYVGLFQALALLPGMSRSGATLVGGMLLGLTRVEATRFAFLLAIPVILGAGTKALIELLVAGSQVALAPLAIASVIAFVTGLLAVHGLLAFMRRYSLWPFICYRLLLAAVVVGVVVLA